MTEILETGSVSLPNFYFRRALRLAPALAISVLTMIVLQHLHEYDDMRAAGCALMYVANYCMTESPSIYDGAGNYLSGAWSLAVEEHFYLIFPLVLLTFFRASIRTLYIAVGVLCAGALAFRLGYGLADRDERVILWRSECAFDLLMGGCLISIMSAHEAGRVALRKIATTDVLALATIVFLTGEILSTTSKPAMAVSQSAVALWLTVMIANLLLNPRLVAFRAGLNMPWLIWLGRISYSLYLWHPLVNLLVDLIYGAIDPRIRHGR